MWQSWRSETKNDTRTRRQRGSPTGRERLGRRVDQICGSAVFGKVRVDPLTQCSCQDMQLRVIGLEEQHPEWGRSQAGLQPCGAMRFHCKSRGKEFEGLDRPLVESAGFFAISC